MRRNDPGAAFQSLFRAMMLNLSKGRPQAARSEDRSARTCRSRPRQDRLSWVEPPRSGIRPGRCGIGATVPRADPGEGPESTRLSRSSRPGPTAGVGHEERFPPPRLNAGCGFRKETIAEIRRKWARRADSRRLRQGRLLEIAAETANDAVA